MGSWLAECWRIKLADESAEKTSMCIPDGTAAMCIPEGAGAMSMPEGTGAAAGTKSDVGTRAIVCAAGLPEAGKLS
jgi:phage FluMu gp28-like protein